MWVHTYIHAYTNSREKIMTMRRGSECLLPLPHHIDKFQIYRSMVIKFSLILFTTFFSHAVSWCMGAEIFYLGRMSSAVLHWVVSPFVARLFERNLTHKNRRLAVALLLIQGHESEKIVNTYILYFQSYYTQFVKYSNCCYTQLLTFQTLLQFLKDHWNWWYETNDDLDIYI